jgi:hypothetical protein
MPSAGGLRGLVGRCRVALDFLLYMHAWSFPVDARANRVPAHRLEGERGPAVVVEMNIHACPDLFLNFF